MAVSEAVILDTIISKATALPVAVPMGLTEAEVADQQRVADAPEDYACACGDKGRGVLCTLHGRLLDQHPDLAPLVAQIARANALALAFEEQAELYRWSLKAWGG
jgi:hypothetical protein